MNEHEARVLTETLFNVFCVEGVAAVEASNPKIVEVYQSRIGQLPRDLGAAVVERLIDSCDRLPRIRDIRELAAEAALGLPSPEEAWEQAMTQGADKHELVREAMQVFGGGFTMRVDDNPGILRTQFKKTYEAKRQRAVDRFDMRDLTLASR